MKKFLNLWILVCLVVSLLPIFVASPVALAVDITVDSYGAGRNDTGEPIGGGEGYSDILTSGDHTVTTASDFFNHMVGGAQEATSGDVIFIADNIDLTGYDEMTLPAGVTLASDRGDSGSVGSRIYVTENGSNSLPHLLYLEDNCRVTGLRVEGMSGGEGPAANNYEKWYGLSAYGSENVIIDNNEIYNWYWAGVSCSSPTKATQIFVYCNYIHHCRLEGYGYGVEVSTGWALIECNRIEYCRHAICGVRGTPTTNYEAIYNIMDHQQSADGSHSIFDCHGGNDVDDPDVYAGGTILIHFNTFMSTDMNPVGIRGIPQDNVTCEYNWTYLNPNSWTEFMAFRQSLDRLDMSPYVDMYVRKNVFGSDRNALVELTGTSRHPSAGTMVMPTQTVTVEDPVPPDPYDPPDPYVPVYDESVTTSTFSTYEQYDSYLYKTNADYTTAHDATTASGVDYTGTYMKVGQVDNVTSSVYSIYRGVLQFNTVSLDAQTDILGARLFLWGKSDNTSGLVDIQAVKGSEFNSPTVTADYGYYTDNTILGYLSTSGSNPTDNITGIPTDAYSYVTLTTEGIANIVRGGITKFGLISSNDGTSTAPTGLEYAEFFTNESGHPPYLEISYSESDLDAPNTTKILSAKVYSDYKESGDQLYCIIYKVVYNTGDPAYDPGDYFTLQLFGVDGTTLVAQTPLPAWGYKPASIYLSALKALPSGQKYVVKLTGVSGRFTPQEEDTRVLGSSSDTWQGKVGPVDSNNNFRKWVIGRAKLMADYYGDVGDYTDVIGNLTKLNTTGGSVFLIGIPGLDTARPDLFSYSSSDYDWGSGSDFDPTLRNKLLNNMGSQLMTAFGNIGGSVGLSATWVNSGLWGLFTIGIVITGLSSGYAVAGMAIGIPALLLGLFMGIPVVIGALLGITLMFLLARVLWAARG